MGWRVWRVVLIGGRLRLWSAVYDEEWPTGEPLAASCRKGHAHAAPAAGCSCGVYALRSPDGLKRYLVGRDDPWVVGRVIGQVELWGDVVEGELGWRAAYASPRSIELAPYVPRTAAASPARSTGRVVSCGSSVPSSASGA